jgi:ferric-dicitrate binding protein FerR (iron transport regulator)
MKETAFKYFEGRATEAEQEQLLNWLRKKENRIVFNSFRLDWKKSLEPGRFPAGGDESWQKLQAVLGQKSYDRWQESRRVQQFFRVAAVFFFVVAMGTLTWYFTQQQQAIPETYTTVVAENGQISKVQLPDGSQVWLNSGSEIAYNNFFSAQNREIILTGEAYFDVAKNEDLPLVVDCSGLKVKVLGTRFNVNAYNENNVAEVVLEEGSVELLNPGAEDAFYRMEPREKVEFNLETRKYNASVVNTRRYTSWIEGIQNIYDLPMEEVVKRLEKRYNQQFELTPEVKKLRYTFTIENESLEDILKLMERITPVKVTQKEEVIKIEIDTNKMREADR